jgi:hypothetical protein
MPDSIEEQVSNTLDFLHDTLLRPFQQIMRLAGE